MSSGQRVSIYRQLSILKLLVENKHARTLHKSLAVHSKYGNYVKKGRKKPNTVLRTCTVQKISVSEFSTIYMYSHLMYREDHSRLIRSLNIFWLTTPVNPVTF